MRQTWGFKGSPAKLFKLYTFIKPPAMSIREQKYTKRIKKVTLSGISIYPAV
jgi:hypothetical protein